MGQYVFELGVIISVYQSQEPPDCYANICLHNLGDWDNLSGDVHFS